MSQHALSIATHLSRNYIVGVEAGLYWTPSPKVVEYLEVDVEEYHDWIREERFALRPKFLEVLESFSCSGKVHPHKEWRKAVHGDSLMGYCKLVKLQQSVVQAYEQGPVEFSPLIRDTMEDLVGIDGRARIERIFRLCSKRLNPGSL
jgi:hypothetical protein